MAVDNGSHAAPHLVPVRVRKQLDILDEIDAALAESQRLYQGNANAIDPFNRVNAVQADEVRQRIVKAREAYVALETQ